jgi:hypothetical protein
MNSFGRRLRLDHQQSTGQYDGTYAIWLSSFPEISILQLEQIIGS